MPLKSYQCVLFGHFWRKRENRLPELALTQSSRCINTDSRSAG